ncbi:MAG TPA: hypothetical protein VFT27_08740 [Actinomycetota bacterium]|nr:hypothetical protein [Actinomycetota bacterium]
MPAEVNPDPERVVEAIVALSGAIHSAAVSIGTRLATRAVGDRADASAAESDRYEQLFVNPTILELARRRGEEGCGGLDHVVVRYGDSSQLLVPAVNGHLSVRVEPEANPRRLLADIRGAAARLGVGADPPAMQVEPGASLALEPFIDGDGPAWARRALTAFYAVSEEVRYVAVHAGSSLAVSSRVADPAETTDRSDRYEELLVNPTLLTLAGARGQIDRGGLRFLIVAYGSFFAFILPLLDGHATISLPRSADPIALAPAIERAGTAIASDRSR